MAAETPTGHQTGERTLIVACGALSRELLQVIEINNLPGVEIECLPASYHNTPDKIPDAVAQRVRAATGIYDTIYVGYADCGTGGRLDAVCEELGVERLPGTHCYEFFAGQQTFAQLHDAEPGTFYLTDFLVKHFDRLVIKALWLDTHPELLSDYFGNYTRLIYLAQTDNPDLVTQAENAAQRLGLRFELCPTGYGELATSLVELSAPNRQPLEVH
ncbi:MAG: DUF1638 domain-containing protein [Actinobacteria bacterium]|jgi:hypothetical protein|nr:DUF1638 domain-containing protein [Actinomycetota bacterium]MBT3747162.1 DUF1638 domain-containing protein [Actinomycetota bacterium]MBT3970195.1 DUF1638 domain-containing protein [Actinomycetota bacterium]MBT4010662.1 DUF1638 domain-containing protein [Actinomycetota bacterium]MBT4303437.1 DUF1638 domain-containing protein [Actinomycetota bacterium]